MTPHAPLRLVVVGGPNGAGKTTLARAYAAAHGLRYLGADDLAAHLAPQDPASARVAAARGFSRALRQAIAARESLVIESMGAACNNSCGVTACWPTTGWWCSTERPAT
jgi:predicted ABC-type ATPase